MFLSFLNSTICRNFGLGGSGKFRDLNYRRFTDDCSDNVDISIFLLLQVFILVGAGIVGGIGLIIVEIIYHKHKIRRAKRTETAKIAFTRWKGTIEVRMK